MNDISPEQKNKKDKLELFLNAPDLALHAEVQAMNDSLKKIADRPKIVQKVELVGITQATIQGKKGDTGESPTDEHLIELITPLIPKPIKGEPGNDGKNGQDSTVPGPQGEPGESIKGADGKDGSPDTGEQIIDKINDDESDKVLKREKVEGLNDELKNVHEKISSIPRGGSRSNNSTKFYPLVADSTTKIFTVPKSVASIVLMSDFPHILFENSGFTINGNRTQITLTVDNAPTTGSQLLYQYSSQFN